MKDIEELVKNVNITSEEQISKLIVDERDLKVETEPNAVVLGGLKQIGVKRIKPQMIPKILLAHPAVERGIEFKMNRMIVQLDKNDISNNIVPFDDSKLSNDSWEYCVKILKNSDFQPLTWVKQFGRDGFRFGDNYFVLIQNKNMNEVLRWELQNPIFFSPMFDSFGGRSVLSTTSNFAFREDDNIRYRINSRTKRPTSYTQLKKVGDTKNMLIGINISDPKLMHFVPSGKVIPASRVVQLAFDRIGDEPFGIPVIQTLWQTVNQIIRVEDAGANTMISFGNNRWVANTPFRSTEKMKQFAKSIQDIAERSTVVLPEGVKLENIKPGSTEFNKVHDILLSLIAMRLGISIVQLKGEGADINKSTLGEMMKDVRHDFFADELSIESAINEGFIKSCKIKFNLRTKQDIETFPYPRFKFSPMQEDRDLKAARFLKESLGLRNLTVSMEKLFDLGKQTQADQLLIYFMDSFLPKRETQKSFSENTLERANDPKEVKKIEKSNEEPNEKNN